MNIQKLYTQVLKEEISKDQFLFQLRKDTRLSHLINNQTNFNDTVKILKNKSILTEGYYDEKPSLEELDSPKGYDNEGLTPLDPEILDNIKQIALKQSTQLYDQIVELEAVCDDDYESIEERVVELCFDYGIELDDEWRLKITPRSNIYKYSINEEVKDLKVVVLKNDNELKGGKGDKLTIDQVNPGEFIRGMQVEKEHTLDVEKRKEIVLDHLAEFPDYYTRLLAMEKKAEKEGSPKVKLKLPKEKKRTDLPIEVGKDNFVDKANGVVNVKKGEKKLKVLKIKNTENIKKFTPPKKTVQQTFSPSKLRKVPVMDLPGKEKKVKIKEGYEQDVARAEDNKKQSTDQSLIQANNSFVRLKFSQSEDFDRFKQNVDRLNDKYHSKFGQKLLSYNSQGPQLVMLFLTNTNTINHTDQEIINRVTNLLERMHITDYNLNATNATSPLMETTDLIKHLVQEVMTELEDIAPNPRVRIDPKKFVVISNFSPDFTPVRTQTYLQKLGIKTVVSGNYLVITGQAADEALRAKIDQLMKNAQFVDLKVNLISKPQ